MIPISTDAPIYYWPVATVSAIVLNVLCFLAFCLNADSDRPRLVAPDGREFSTEEQLEQEMQKFESGEDAEQFFESLEIRYSNWRRTLSVEFGTVKPWQWLTNNFMHAGWGHIIGNMIFLWAFGLIVEGKVGPYLFAAIYLGIGTLYGCCLQMASLMMGWEGSALGASAAIFGLLALCIAWAPANEFTVLLRFSTFDISILLYGFLFVAQEVAFWALSGFQMSSELLHILGFLVGLPIGLWMVTSGHVDCEGWDLFSYLRGQTGEDSTTGKAKIQTRKIAATEKHKALTAQQRAQESATRAETERRLHDQVQHAIDEGNVDLAIKLQERLTKTNPTMNWRQKDLYRVIQTLLKSKNYDQALPLIQSHIDLFEHSRFAMQVTMMKIWLSQRESHRTLEYLQGFNPSFMEPNEVAQMEQLTIAAKKQLAAKLQTKS